MLRLRGAVSPDVHFAVLWITVTVPGTAGTENLVNGEVINPPSPRASIWLRRIVAPCYQTPCNKLVVNHHYVVFDNQ